jgi:hypothetical protein
MTQRNGARELGLIVATLAVLSRFVADDTLLGAAVLIVFVAVAGTAGILGEWRPWRWPAAHIVLPGLAAFGAVGAVHLMDPVPWLGPTFVATWIVVTWVVGAEIDLVGRAAADAVREERAHAAVPVTSAAAAIAAVAAATERAARNRPTTARLGAFGLAFLGYVAVGGLVPGALAGDGQQLTAAVFAATVVLDVVVGVLAGYRLTALGPHTRGKVLVAIYLYALILVPVAVTVRVLALPRLFGPAVLALATYVITSLRESDEPLRFNGRLLEETAALVVAGALVVVVGLLAR